MRNKRPTLIDVVNDSWPPYGIAATGIATGVHLQAGDGWCVAVSSVLCLFCISVTMTRILEKDETDE